MPSSFCCSISDFIGANLGFLVVTRNDAPISNYEYEPVSGSQVIKPTAAVQPQLLHPAFGQRTGFDQVIKDEAGKGVAPLDITPEGVVSDDCYHRQAWDGGNDHYFRLNSVMDFSNPICHKQSFIGIWATEGIALTMPGSKPFRRASLNSD